MSNNLRASTVKALAACRTVGLSYHGRLEGETVFWATDGESYHVVRKRTTAGVARAAHYCQTYRTGLSGQLGEIARDMKTRLHLIPVLSREYTNIELTMVSPAWLCDVDSEFIEILDDTAAALSEIWIEGAPC
jgi:hypothetical protein